MFNDLKDSAIAVLNSAEVMNDSVAMVDVRLLRQLQSELNIHFVEPDAPQVEIV